MTMQTKTIGRMPTDHGPWVPGTVAGKKFHYQLFGCDWESLHDNNNTPPAVWDGGDIITPNTNDWKKVSGDYQAWLLKQNHPATTGTTGDYPYNGMGRVDLPKNMVNTGTSESPVMVNQLTQDMFYKGAVGSRVPNTNTIFVIRYDYVLGEDITVPANCVLEFDGGSLSDGKLIGNNTIIIAEEVAIFDNIVFDGTWTCENIYSTWFKDAHVSNKLKEIIKLTKGTITNNVYIRKGDYTFDVEALDDVLINCNSNTHIILDGNIVTTPTSFYSYSIIKVMNCSNVSITGSGLLRGESDEHIGNVSWWGNGIYIYSSDNVKVNGIEISYMWGTGIYLGERHTNAAKNITIDNCTIHHCRLCGIALVRADNVSVSNCYIHNIYCPHNYLGAEGQCAIDIEPNYSDISNVIIKNVIAEDCYYGFVAHGTNKNGNTKNIIIENCRAQNSVREELPITFSYGIAVKGVKDISFNNCEIINAVGSTLSFEGGDVAVNNCRIINTAPEDASPSLLIQGSSNVVIEQCYIESHNKPLLRECSNITLRKNVLVFRNMYYGYPNDVTNNIYEQNIFKGFDVQGVTTLSSITFTDHMSNFKILNNKFVSQISGNASYFIFKGNTFDDGIDISIGKSVFEDNILYGGGTLRANGSKAAKNKWIVNSKNSRNHSRLDIYLSNGACFADNYIENNISIEDLGGSSISGVVYVEMSDSKLSHNLIIPHSNAKRGIYIGSCTNSLVDSNRVKGELAADKIELVGPAKSNVYAGMYSNTGQTRPDFASMDSDVQIIGFCFFDTTLGKPIYWTGSVWVDATGTPV